MPPSETDRLLSELSRWLVRNARAEGDPSKLFPAYCNELVRQGVSLGRASLGLEYLHPEVSGSQVTWSSETVTVSESIRMRFLESEDYRNSPTRIVDETEDTFRRRLDAPVPDMPLLDRLRREGLTDYVMFPLPFIDHTRTAALSFATRATGGFRDDDLVLLRLVADLFSPYAERHVLRRIAIDLLDTYVGRRTGRRVFEGGVERGQVELIETAIWLADLRGFTRMSEQVSRDEVVATLNEWLGAMVAAVDAHGGEVLKFIGDAMLAIFPVGAAKPPAHVCARAVEAARQASAEIDRLNASRTTPLDFGLALHFGEVAYGNIGGRRRLDFTVIGPAINYASRLEELTKTLRKRVLVSNVVSDLLAQPLPSLGSHVLRDIPARQTVFDLPC